MNAKQVSVLLKTSGRGSIQYSDGVYTIAGATFRKNEIKSIRHLKYKAQVLQVITIAGQVSSGVYYTPTAATTYQVKLLSPQRRYAAVTQGQNIFSYTTPSDITVLGATAALQREAINAALVASINSGYSAYITAASLGTGTGFTLTDVGPYYGVRKQGVFTYFGATQVELALDSNGYGFPDTAIVASGGFGYRVLTTPAVYSNGVGADLLNNVPVVDQMYGNVISGVTTGQAMFNPPSPKATDGTFAVSGQNYDLFMIEWLQHADIPTVGMRLAFEENQTFIFVDNGTGTTTTNLQGFLDFEKSMHKIIYDRNSFGATIGEFFDDGGMFQGVGGAVPSGTDGATNIMATSYGQYDEFIIGTSTQIVPTPGNTGWNIELDATSGEGDEITPAIFTDSPKEFTVGSETAQVYCKFIETTVADGELIIGFRKKEAFQKTITNYSFYGYVKFDGAGTPAAAITTEGKLAAISEVLTPSTTAIVNATWNEAIIQVAIDGTVTILVNGISYPIYSVGTTPLKFAAGSVIIPSIRYTNNGSSAAVPVLGQWIVTTNSSWIF